ncbi:TetR/AcrR family transcriptional regulator [Alloscardovia sp. HMSC034E08]|uniref:TetR/AcrR family transcriptional regulator n=1 Tax=Alloscardovia sp. HMSC034E08 TaxID=1739413 RepID=UPI0009FD7990|nr:TetR/AcrR family transcriptional regulator [Alloscardovia sp. HMSC034E08]
MYFEPWEQFRQSHVLSFDGESQARKLVLSEATHKKRMTADERREQIAQSAARIIAQKGFWGMSLRDIAEDLNITEALIYYYVDSKDDLLRLVIKKIYDSQAMDNFNYSNALACDTDGGEHCYFPRFTLNIVLTNCERTMLVKLFTILYAESLDPQHPAHDYFINRHRRFWSIVSEINWMLPEPYASDRERFYELWSLAMSVMGGLQLRWLADDSMNLVNEWMEFCAELFPLDVWEGYIDPVEFKK